MVGMWAIVAMGNEVRARLHGGRSERLVLKSWLVELSGKLKNDDS